MLTHPHGQQPIDLSLDLRRRRYGTSHGVGLLHCLGGLEGTYAVALTAPADLQQLEDAAVGAPRYRLACVSSSPVRRHNVVPWSECGLASAILASCASLRPSTGSARPPRGYE